MLNSFFQRKKRIYFDNASARGISNTAKKSFLNTIGFYANPSSIHEEGESAKNILEEARRKIALFLKVKKSNIYFASSATEANNIFIKGVILEQLVTKNKAHIIYSESDHSSIVEAVKQLKQFGAQATSVKPNKIGEILASEIVTNLNEDTKLVCLSLVNSELGTIQNIRDIVLELRKACEEKNFNMPKVFVDASQAVEYMNLDASNLLVDGLTFGGAKLGALHGAAVLYVKNGVKLLPLISGGGQEEGVRGGTENLLAIVSLSETLSNIDRTGQAQDKKYVYGLRNYLIEKLNENFTEKEIEIFGDTKFKHNSYFKHAAPHILLISLKDIIGEETLLRLDAKGIAVSTASACSLQSGSGSNFLKSIGDPVLAKETIRISLSKENTKKEIDYFIECLKEIKDKYQKSGLY